MDDVLKELKELEDGLQRKAAEREEQRRERENLDVYDLIGNYQYVPNPMDE